MRAGIEGPGRMASARERWESGVRTGRPGEGWGVGTGAYRVSGERGVTRAGVGSRGSGASDQCGQESRVRGEWRVRARVGSQDWEAGRRVGSRDWGVRGEQRAGSRPGESWESRVRG